MFTVLRLQCDPFACRLRAAQPVIGGETRNEKNGDCSVASYGREKRHDACIQRALIGWSRPDARPLGDLMPLPVQVGCLLAHGASVPDGAQLADPALQCRVGRKGIFYLRPLFSRAFVR